MPSINPDASPNAPRPWPDTEPEHGKYTTYCNRVMPIWPTPTPIAAELPVRPRLLDLFCCAGGAAMGYHLAGFEVVGVDVRPQPHYPFEFHQADAMTFPLEGFDAVHASPPCQDHSALKATMPESHGTGWMLAATVARLQASGVPWVVENVEGATMPADTYSIVLCGSSFGLRVRRHRRFATNVFVMTPPCDHRAQGPAVDVTGHGMQGREYRRRKALGLPLDTQADRQAAMGIDWMNRDELAQAIPPAYTEFIGAQLLSARWVRVNERPEDTVNGAEPLPTEL